MNPTRGASVTIRVAPVRGGLRIAFTSRRRGVLPVVHVISDFGLIAEARHELDHGLTKLKDIVPALQGDERELQRMATVLGSTGRRMMGLLFGHNPALIDQLGTFWRQALPAWRNPVHTPEVECLGDEKQLLPLEFLPLLAAGECDTDITGRDDFGQKMRAFIGFSCVVRRRVLPQPVSGLGGTLATDADGRLTMRYLHHDGLNGAKAEYAWLSSAAQAHVRLLGPIPAGPLKTSELTHQLFDPTWSADGPVVEATALEHFACHCFTSTRARPFDYELELRGCGHEVRVTLGDLSEELIAIASRGPRREMDMPLVVLNACGSSKVDPTTSVSFPKLFMENGNRGFLGPEIAIPDDVAAAFSEEFYRSLLLREQTFGTAVHTARLHLLARYLNPLGLAYVAYGNTDLRISQWKEAQA